MSVPPRSKKENIMTPHWWLYGNFPHVFFEAMMVIACLAFTSYLFTGQVQRPDIQDNCINTYNSDGKAAYPLACVCNRFQYSDNDWNTIVDWYIPKTVTVRRMNAASCPGTFVADTGCFTGTGNFKTTATCQHGDCTIPVGSKFGK